LNDGFDCGAFDAALRQALADFVFAAVTRRQQAEDIAPFAL